MLKRGLGTYSRSARFTRELIGVAPFAALSLVASLHCAPKPETSSPGDATQPGYGHGLETGHSDNGPSSTGTSGSNRSQDGKPLETANADPARASSLPNWDESAMALRNEFLPKFKATPPEEDIQVVCETMLDAAAEFYRATEPSKEIRKQREYELSVTRKSDLAHCIRKTSVRAGACVTAKLSGLDSEFPWLLDQCMRAFPLTEEFSLLEGQADSRKPTHGAAGIIEPVLESGLPEKDETKADSFEMTFVGDVIFGRYRKQKFDPIPEWGVDPFVYIKPLLEADLTVANLETPVVEHLPQRSPIGSRFRFGASKDMARLLVSAGIDVVSLANNHYFDLRERGQLETPQILKELGIDSVGSSLADEPPIRVETINKNGWKIGVIAVTCVRNAPARKYGLQLPFVRTRELANELKGLVAAANQEHDVVAVLVHWGIEYAAEPEVYQREVAHELIDAGADLLIGHHPHVLQGIEHYNGGVIAYSLGNFLFEDISDVPRQTGVLRVRFEDKRDSGACIDDVVLHPAYLKRYPIQHPVPADGRMASRVRARVKTQADALGTNWDRVDGEQSLRISGLKPCGGEEIAHADVADLNLPVDGTSDSDQVSEPAGTVETDTAVDGFILDPPALVSSSGAD